MNSTPRRPKTTPLLFVGVVRLLLGILVRWHLIASVSRDLGILVRWHLIASVSRHLRIFVRWNLNTFRWLHSALIGILIWRFKLFRGDRRFRFLGGDWRSRLIRSGLFIGLRVGARLSEAQAQQGSSKPQTQLGNFGSP